MAIAIDYLVVGHATQDLLPDGSQTAGGTVTYSGIAASRLGCDVRVLTSAHRQAHLFESCPDIQVHNKVADVSTVFENRYVGGARQQYVRARAQVLTASDLPSGWDSPDIVHLGPNAQEVSEDLVQAFPGVLMGATPQGWLREWDGDGLVRPVPWSWPEAVLGRIDALILSVEDIGEDPEQTAFFRAHCRLFVLTVGRQGAIVYQSGNENRVAAFEAHEVDPTGAGDVFAAAFLIRYHETNDAMESARFGNAAASFVIEAVGATHLPSRAEVEARLVYGRQRS